jgi:hypothetical protein
MEHGQPDVQGEEALAEPIEWEPVADPASILRELKLAPPSKALVEKGEYDKAYRELTKQSGDPDVANNLGCVSAWLAVSEQDAAYWPEALRALREARDKGNEKQRERAEFNLERVRLARKAT